MKTTLLLGVCALTMGASALELAGWRGETVSALLGDNEKIGPAPAGLTVKLGVAHEVMYAVKPKGHVYAFTPDRVEWGGAGAGPRVLQVRVAADAKPGVHAFGDVTFRVVDRTLPPAKDWKYNLDLWQHPWAVARQAGVKPFSKAHYDAMRPVWELLASAGQKALTVSLIDLPWNHQCYDGYEAMVKYVRRADGTTATDFALFDAYVAFGRSCGIGPQIACYTMCPWGYKVSWFDEKGNIQKAEAKPGTPFFREYWGPFLTAFAAHLKEKGWFADTYIALDERTPEDLRNTVAFMNEKAPGLKISMAGNRLPSDFKGIDIDCYSQGLGHLGDKACAAAFRAECAARRAAGKITTFYVCCGPSAPNTFMHSGTDEAFWLGAAPAMTGFDGLLRWAWNSWPKDPAANASYGEWASGDTFLVYPGAQPSLRFLALLNGIQQAEKFTILRAAGADKAALDALETKYDVHAALAVPAGSGRLRELEKLTCDTLNK